ncbi:MAG: hypothetical protein WC955_02410 [Elusimicrobiota bacterium]
MKNKFILKTVLILIFSTLLGCTKSGEIHSIKPGEKVQITGGDYFQYDFDKNPALGMVIVKINVFDSNGKNNNEYTITGISGMPSMKGAHDSQEIEFKQNTKGDYLLPVNVVMPGKWEVKIKFLKNQDEIYSDTIRFNVG